MSDSARMRIESVRESIAAARDQIDHLKAEEQRKRKRQVKLKKQVALSSSIIEASKDPELEDRIRQNKWVWSET